MENKKILEIEYVDNEKISNLTTYKNVGCIKGAFYPKNEQELILCYNFLTENNLPFKIIGNGSNLLISEKSNILAISTKKMKKNIRICENNVYASSSVMLAEVYKHCSLHNLRGFEVLASIPATIGGAIKMNASAFGNSIFDNLEKVKIYNQGKVKYLKKNDIIFSYHSTNLGQNLILSAKFTLKKDNYCQITKDFSKSLSLRRFKQPQGLSCGSVFKNPPLLSAGKLIEDCGLKGLRQNGAFISQKHGNFIINEGNAKFDDILYLINLCQIKVFEKYGILLEPEVEIIH